MKKGYELAEMSWLLEDNVLMQRAANSWVESCIKSTASTKKG